MATLSSSSSRGIGRKFEVHYNAIILQCGNKQNTFLDSEKISWSFFSLFRQKTFYFVDRTISFFCINRKCFYIKMKWNFFFGQIKKIVIWLKLSRNDVTTYALVIQCFKPKTNVQSNKNCKIQHLLKNIHYTQILNHKRVKSNTALICFPNRSLTGCVCYSFKHCGFFIF